MTTEQRGLLGRLIKVLSLLALMVVYIGSLWATYRQLDAEPVFDGALGVPSWGHAALVMGLMVCGGLGITAAIIDGRRESSSWLITMTGVAAALAWSLWASLSKEDDSAGMLFAALSPVISLLALVELMRRLRTRPE
ncbi:hypothetical protein ACFYN9_04155 [Streptomyces collinus]|uniref:Uncharacterized protein n=1 Tax=Streptomyces collinus TaxID=42684 RepID=A0AA89Q197_STRCU|nr:hypothetical protein [Streptomyces collinus]MBB5810713.1 hypothetical protein [Streptomyces collinus]WMX63987.1 hypothetical protein RFN52_11680 [Streptomyces collinus]